MLKRCGSLVKFLAVWFIFNDCFVSTFFGMKDYAICRLSQTRKQARYPSRAHLFYFWVTLTAPNCCVCPATTETPVIVVSL